MAITKNLLTGSSGTADTTVYNTASVSPAASRLILLAVKGIRFDGAGWVLPSISGLGLTWNHIRTQQVTGDTKHGIALFWAETSAGAPTPGAITITFVQQQFHCAWSVVEFATVDLGSPIVQSVQGSANVSTHNLNLAAFGSAVNATYACWGLNDNVAGTIGSGFEELHDILVESAALYVEWRADADTSADYTTATQERDAGIAVEIRHAVLAPITPSPTTVPLVVAAPTISRDQFLNPSPIGMLVAVLTPSVTTVSLEPSSVVVPLSVPSPAVSHTLSLSPVPVTTPILPVAPSITFGQNVAPAPVTTAIALTQPSVTPNFAIAPSPVALLLTPMAPVVVVGGQTISPTAIAVPLATTAPAIAFGQTISPIPLPVLIRVVPLVVGASGGGGIRSFTQHRLGKSYAYIYEPDGTLVSSTIEPFHYRINRYYDRVGDWNVDLPVDQIVGVLPLARQIGAGWRISIRQDNFNPNHATGEGFLLYKGVVETRQIKLSAGGQSALSLSGSFRELAMVRRTIGLGYEYDTTLGGFTDALIGDLLDGDDAIIPDAAASLPLSGVFTEPLSRYAAWLKGLAAARYSVRESWENDKPELVPYAGPPNPGVVIRKLYDGEDRYLHENGETGVGLIAGEPSIRYDGSQLYNRIIAYGTDTVVDPADSTKTVTGSLTLNNATLSSPYTVQSDLNPDGTTYYYIEDADSIALYGLIEHVMIRPDIKNPNDNLTSRAQAANVLYWTAVNELIKHRSEKISISIGPLANGAHIWNLPGDQSWVQYEGSVKLENGDDSVWIDLEKRFVLAERHDESHPSGIRRVEFVLTAAEMEFPVGDLPEVINPFDPEGPTLPDLNFPPMPDMPEIPGLDLPELELPEIPGITDPNTGPPEGGGGGVVVGQLRLNHVSGNVYVLERWDGTAWQNVEALLAIEDPGSGALWLEPP